MLIITALDYLFFLKKNCGWNYLIATNPRQWRVNYYPKKNVSNTGIKIQKSKILTSFLSEFQDTSEFTVTRIVDLALA